MGFIVLSVAIWIEAILVVFMTLGGINFALYFRAQSLRHWREILWNVELRAYLAILGIGTVLVTMDLWRNGAMAWCEAIRRSLFQVVSITTSTGFATADFNLWPAFATAVMLTNVGPGLGAVGPIENYALIPAGGKLFLTFLMLTGRLELFGVLVFLLPQAWAPRRRKSETTPPRLGE